MGKSKDIQLGWCVRDTITGFQGIAVRRLEYIDGGIDIGIQTQASAKEGTMPKIEYISLAQLQKVDEGIYVAPIKRAIGFTQLEDKGAEK